MYNILQWNINSLQGHYEILQNLILDYNSNIVCLQETNSKDSQTIKMRKFTCYNKNRSDCKSSSGGVVILINNQIYSQAVQLNTEIEAVTAQIILDNKHITICNVYLSNQYEINERY